MQGLRKSGFLSSSPCLPEGCPLCLLLALPSSKPFPSPLPWRVLASLTGWVFCRQLSLTALQGLNKLARDGASTWPVHFSQTLLTFTITLQGGVTPSPLDVCSKLKPRYVLQPQISCLLVTTTWYLLDCVHQGQRSMWHSLGQSIFVCNITCSINMSKQMLYNSYHMSFLEVVVNINDTRCEKCLVVWLAERRCLKICNKYD